jgi:hypothetical protein
MTEAATRPAGKVCYCSVFAVHQTPYCVWSFDLRRDNLEFLNGIDPEFFHYLSKVHGANVNDEKDAHAAMSLRLAYHHGLETLFTLLAGALQAPEALVAWVPKCSNPKLRTIVEEIQNNNQSLLRILPVREVSWRGLSELINNFGVPSDVPDPVEGFAEIWTWFAHDFLSEPNRLELNSIKHGLRARFGGFSMKLDPKEGDSKNYEGSKFGTRFFVPSDSPSAPDGNCRLRRVAVNWIPQTLVDSLVLITMSLTNILTFLRKVNKDDMSNAKLNWPTSKDPLLSLVSTRTDVISAQIEEGVPAPKPLTRDEMLKLLSDRVATLTTPK